MEKGPPSAKTNKPKILKRLHANEERYSILPRGRWEETPYQTSSVF